MNVTLETGESDEKSEDINYEKEEEGVEGASVVLIVAVVIVVVLVVLGALITTKVISVGREEKKENMLALSPLKGEPEEKTKSKENAKDPETDEEEKKS